MTQALVLKKDWERWCAPITVLPLLVALTVARENFCRLAINTLEAQVAYLRFCIVLHSVGRFTSKEPNFVSVTK